MSDWTERTSRLLGDKALARLQQTCVAVVGIGGVGSFAVEFLVRAGVGQIVLVDSDEVEASNRNRQLPAMVSTEGKLKTAVMAERLCDINPLLKCTVFPRYMTEEDAADFVQHKGVYELAPAFDFVVDAIDSMGPKTALIQQCLQQGVPIVSAMGAAGKMNPELVRQCDISQTYQCALAKSLRHRLSLLGIKRGLPVVFSPEPTYRVPASDAASASIPASDAAISTSASPTLPGTISYMPAVFGGHIASYVVREIILKA